MSSKFEKMVKAIKHYAMEMCTNEKTGDYDTWLVNNQEKAIRFLFEHENKRISERTKLIVYCLAAKLNVNESNKVLRKYHREELYVRNLSDIAIMRALELGYDAKQLCDLMATIIPLSSSVPSVDFFTKKDAKGNSKFICTIETMEAYLDYSRVEVTALEADLNSEISSKMKKQTAQDNIADDFPHSFYDKKLTREMTNELKTEFDLAIEKDDDYFVGMILDKIELFSAVRERTRREFVRNLYDYARTINKQGNIDDILPLYMNVNTEPNEQRRPINFKNLVFDVNEFYQGCLFGIEEREYSGKDHLDFEPLDSKEDRIAWREQSEEEEDIEQAAAQKKCARLLTGLLQGKNDISRTFFISLLLFFNVKKNEHLSIQKLNGTLSKCGWRQIDVHGNDAFDRLAIDIIDYYNEKDISYSDFLDILLQDLEDDVFEKYEGDDANMTMDEAITKTLR